jgi:hypothetical protein
MIRTGQIVVLAIKKAKIRQQNVISVNLVVVWAFLRLLIVIINWEQRQKCRHTYQLVLVLMVLMVITQGKQLREVLTYLKMPLLINGQQIWMIMDQKMHQLPITSTRSVVSQMTR